MGADVTVGEFTSGLGLLLATAAPVLAYFALVGLAVRLLLFRVAVPAGLGMLVGMGAAVASLTLTLSFVLTRTLTPTVWALAWGSGAVVLVALLVGRGALLRRWRRLVCPSDAVGLGAALAILVPVLGYGQRPWTLGAGDFVRYAGSVRVWASEAGEDGDYLSRYLDDFGELMYARGMHEKPVVTAIMTVLDTVGGVSPERQLTLLTFVFLAVGVAAMTALVRDLFRIRVGLACLAVLPGAFSSVVLFRVYEAQGGQVVALALLAVLLVLVHALARAARADTAAVGLVLGVVGAAALGSNSSLILGAAPTLAALGLYLMSREGLPVPVALGRLILPTLVATGLSAPLWPLFAWSMRSQGTGEAGYPIPLSSPLALVGLERLSGPVGGLGALLAWGLFLLLLFGVWRSVHRPVETWRLLVVRCALLVVANGLLLMGLFGLDSYNANKWLALVLPLVSPLILASFLTLRRGQVFAASRTTVAYCSLASLLVGAQLGTQIRHVIPQDVLELEHSAVLAGVDMLNIDNRADPASQVLAGPMATSLVPSRRVNLLNLYGEPGGPPVGHTILTSARKTPAGQVRDRKVINSSYALVERYAPLPWGPTGMGQDNPSLPAQLFGRWASPETGGTWTDGSGSYLVFDVPEDAGNQVSVTLTGYRLLPADGDPRVLRVRSHGRLLAQERFTRSSSQDVEFTLTAQDVVDGQVTLELQAPSPVREQDGDRRTLGYLLESVTLRPAGSGAGG